MTDPVLAAVTDLLTGQPGAAVRLEALWDEVAAAPAGGGGGAWDRCVLAHYLADTCTAPGAALVWNERALAAADDIGPGEVSRFGFDREQMLPSLHLNVAADLAELGEVTRARRHLRLAREHLDHLTQGTAVPDPDGIRAGYAATIAGGLDRLERRLAHCE